MSASADPKTILVRAPNWIGDQVMTYPFFHWLRASFPKARIVSVCMPWVSSIQYRNLIDDVFVLPRPPGVEEKSDKKKPKFLLKFDALEQAGRDLKNRGPWDLGISLPNSFSAAWLLWRAGCRVRRGYPGDARSLLLTERISHKGHSETHRAESYQQLLCRELSRPAKQFWGNPPVDDLDPGVPGVVPAFDPASAWPGSSPVAPPPGNYWVLAPGAVAESRRWPVERFLALADLIISATGYPGVVVGGPGEAALGVRLAEGVRRPGMLLDKTAQGAVSSLWKIFRNARFTIANDSGLAHVAALCGSPVQIIWGAGDPKRTLPIGPGKVNLSLNPVPCWPCERNVCSKEGAAKIQCLRGIQPEQVWADAGESLKPNGDRA